MPRLASVLSCAGCGRQNPEGFAYCGFCGTALGEHGRSVSLPQERRVVSVLFCDLVGFTAASERTDPEDVRARLRPYYERLRTTLEGFGATVEKFIGDAVMAVFGAPVAHEDDAERVVRAGLRVLEEVADLNASYPELELMLQVRVGINTGEAIVDLDARPERGEGIALGDVVNTAARLQAAAPVGGVAVGELTYRLTKHRFRYEPLEPVVAKGKSELISAWQPVVPLATTAVSPVADESPFVGRGPELTLLEESFRQTLASSSLSLVTIVAEAGIGKSRLTREFRRFLHSHPRRVVWHTGRCLPYGDGVSLWALGEIVKSYAGILESDSPEAAEQKLAAVLPEVEERSWLLARLLALVGVDSGQRASQEESFAAWRRFMEVIVAAGPAVILFEDIHWADGTLLDFLVELPRRLAGVPLLLLATARPELLELYAEWPQGSDGTVTVTLAPLTDAAAAELVANLAANRIRPELERSILERAAGNPLYAEELVRLASREDGHLDELELPDSLQALIAARLDTLAPERKRLLQDASVIGRVFWAGAVAEVAGRGLEEVEAGLADLSRRGFVRASLSSSMERESEHSFFHELVRDVAYRQIPRAERGRLHKATAVWIERKAGGRIDDLAEVLAYHSLAALDLARAAGLPDRDELQGRAVRYLRLAGERALGLDVERAERHLARALELTPEGHRERGLLLERWARAAQSQNRLREAQRTLEQALAQHRERGDALGTGRTLSELSRVFWHLGDPRHETALREALQLLESQGPSRELVGAYVRLGGFRYVTAAYAEAIADAERALRCAAELALPEPPGAVGIRGVARALLGQRQGVEEMRRALVLAVEQGEGVSAADLYNSLALVTWLYEGPQASLDVLQEGIDFSLRRGIADAAESMAAGKPPILAEVGRVQQALADAVPLADRLQRAESIAFTEPRSLQVRLLAERGEHDQAPAPEPLLAAARDTGEPQFIAMAVAAAAPLLCARGRCEQARALLIELDEVTGIRADPVYASYLPGLVRTALALGEAAVGSRLADGVEPVTPLHEHALSACRAQLAEAADEHVDAVRLYADAADRWRRFGNVPERAYALLGHGRSALAARGTGAERPLTEARSLFVAMGYRPALAEAEALLDRTRTPRPRF
jgi:class 3 adenylate cyclase/tetratricopeptide (TPR) repeat protein